MAGITVKEAAKLLGKTTSNIYYLISKKHLRVLKNGLVSQNSVDKLVKNPLKKGRPHGMFKR